MSSYNLTLEQIKKYLSSTDWKYKILKPMNSIVFVPASNISANNYLYVPLETDNLTLESDIKNIIHSISRIKGCTTDEIYEDILKYTTVPVDTLDLRLISRLSDAGTIPLGLATTILDSLKKLIVDSITYELSPKRFHKRISTNANDIYDNFIFNQTKKGSFIFSIQTSDLTSEIETDCLEECIGILEPMERRALERIQFTFQNIAEALLYKDIANSMKYMLTPKVMDSMNANMCDSLITIFDNHQVYMRKNNIYGGLKIESTTSFSPIISARNKDLKLNSQVTINSNAGQILKYVSEELKRSSNDNQDVLKLIGNVTSLNLYKSHDIYKGYIRMQVLNHKEIKSISISLATHDYNLALDAQKHNCLITITGVPIKDIKTNRWTLENISDISIINPNIQQTLK